MQQLKHYELVRELIEFRKKQQKKSEFKANPGKVATRRRIERLRDDMQIKNEFLI